ncbi:MAG: DNA replication/repair protein RecF [Nitrospirae bacterium]|nr:DNA replication/repair protein RecF [Nitrospirota bacterium]
MFLKELSLRNFRNYTDLSIQFNKGLNIFIGENAQGKTSLLEAAHFIHSLQSFRTQDEKSLINISSNDALLSAEVEREGNVINLSVLLDDKGKRVKLNGKKVAKASELLSRLAVITFSPDDLFLIKDLPSERRRYFDKAILPHSPSYLKTCIRYDNILEQRNRLLKGIRDKKRDEEKGLLRPWDEQLVEEGTRILFKRRSLVEQIRPFLEKIFQAISRDNKRPILIYETQLLPAEALSEGNVVLRCSEAAEQRKTEADIADKVKGLFYQLLEEKRKEEFRYGYTLVGPHRDDFQFSIDDQRAKTTASQGQHRMIILALKLSEAVLYKEAFGEYPVLLLDDVFSELDEIRAEALIEQIHDMNIEQVFITAAKKESIPFSNKGCSFYLIKEGTVKPYNS